ncbi:GntR family transcriptional regulator [Compostibacter hankyongensis]|uniref:GntR family transcriptional regulator n=1 Tax=Compostibacter hankyongensis TaxID=1007089 RepID=A0ABP8G407_9BACT
MKKQQPKFLAISEDIIAKIASGELQPGDKVPSENEIIHSYRVSNTTARKSLLEIELKGWGRRIKGKGTFVVNRTRDHQLLRVLGSIGSTRRGFNESLEAEGFTPRNIILEKTVLQDGISSEINGQHFIIQGSVLKIHQLRYADDVLMKDEVKYISLELCPKIHMTSTEKSYFKLYEDEYYLKITDVKQTLSADILQPGAPDNNFDTREPIPIFILDSSIVTKGGKVVEIERSYYRGDKYKFAIIAHPEL